MIELKITAETTQEFLTNVYGTLSAFTAAAHRPAKSTVEPQDVREQRTPPCSAHDAASSQELTLHASEPVVETVVAEAPPADDPFPVSDDVGADATPPEAVSTSGKRRGRPPGSGKKSTEPAPQQEPDSAEVATQQSPGEEIDTSSAAAPPEPAPTHDELRLKVRQVLLARQTVLAEREGKVLDEKKDKVFFDKSFAQAVEHLKWAFKPFGVLKITALADDHLAEFGARLDTLATGEDVA